jgi:hypothetical protein
MQEDTQQEDTLSGVAPAGDLPVPEPEASDPPAPGGEDPADAQAAVEGIQSDDLQAEDFAPDASPTAGVHAEARGGHRSRHRVLVLTDRIGATQTISFTQPINLESGDFESIDLFTYNAAQLAYLSQEEYWRIHKPTVLILSRHTDARVLPVLSLARSHGVPAIFHIDDDLLEVTTTLGSERLDFYQDPERQRTIRNAHGLVDLIYASTAPLAARLAEHGVTTEIVAGRLYCSIDPRRLVEPLPATGPVIGYMGSGGHAADLGTIMPVVVRLMREMPALRFETFGTIPPPAEMAEFGARFQHHAGFTDYAAFVERLCELGWWVGLAPLADNSFNRCKADTKWVEYSLAGMAVAASDLPVYHRACDGGCGALASSEDEWYARLSLLLRDGAGRRRMVAAARAKLAASYTHAQLQQQLVDVIARATREYERNQAGA